MRIWSVSIGERTSGYKALDGAENRCVSRLNLLPPIDPQIKNKYSGHTHDELYVGQ